MLTSGRCLFVFIWLLVLSPVSHAKLWPSSKFEVPSMAQSFYSMGASKQEELNPASVHVLIWNMLKGERSKWPSDFLALGADKDILMLQEAYLNQNMTDTLAEVPGVEFFMGVSFLYKKKNMTATGTLLGTRVLPTQAYMMRTRNFEPIIKTPKTTTAALLPFTGKNKKLLVLNIHGINFANHQAFVNHVAQAVEQIKTHQGPILYAGDFNTRTAKRIAHLRRVMAENGLSEVKWKNDSRKRWLGHPLDQAFIRGLMIKNAEVRGEIKSSDHKPMDLHLAYEGE